MNPYLKRHIVLDFVPFFVAVAITLYILYYVLKNPIYLVLMGMSIAVSVLFLIWALKLSLDKKKR